MPYISQNKKKKTNRSKKGPESKRFKGLFLHIIVLLFVSLPLALVLLVPTPPVKQIERPPFENFSRAPSTVHKRSPAKPKARKMPLPLVAIIIDDMGYDYAIDERFLKLPVPLSFAFLPYGPNTKRLARLARSKNRDVLVHVPMEPENKMLNPGPGVLTLAMSVDSLIETLEQDIQEVPGAVGVNNHMGSRFTADRKAMKYVLAILKQKGLFFIDSRTTKNTVAFEMARQMGVPCGERAVFLDHSDNRKLIEHQVMRLVRLAQRDGSAIGIGHPYVNTYKVLYKMLPIIQKDVAIVPVHRLVQ